MFHLFFDGNEKGMEGEKGQSKYIFLIRKNIQNRCLFDKSLLKSLSNRQNEVKSVIFYSFTEL